MGHLGLWVNSMSKQRQDNIRRSTWILAAVAVLFFVAIMVVEYYR